MFEDDSEEHHDERPLSAADRAKDKSDEFRMHAELAAIFEAHRKFDAQLLAKLDPEIARNAQKTIARLEKGKLPDTPVIDEKLMPDAAQLLNLSNIKNLSTNDYHIYRRPGEIMILRWIQGDQVETFYQRLQAHF